MQSACFEKRIFECKKNQDHCEVSDGLEPWLCVDIKRIVASEIASKAFGTFEKQAPGLS